MLDSTRAVVLHTLPYSDRYLIVHTYTESFGRVSFLTARTRGKRTLVPISLFRPMAVVDLVTDQQSKRELQRIHEAKLSFPQLRISSDPVKSAIGLFLSEVLFRTLRTSESDPQLFAFLYDSIELLDEVEMGVANFHIVFLLRLLHYVGIFPNTDSYEAGAFFDMRSSVFTMGKPVHDNFLSPSESAIFEQLLRISYGNMSLYRFSREDRVKILTHILVYYRLHLPEFPEIKSFAVLQSLFD